MVRSIPGAEVIRFTISTKGFHADDRLPSFLIRLLTHALVTNSVEAFRISNRRQPAIALKLNAARRAIRLIVSDNGPGWESEVRLLNDNLRRGIRFSTKGEGRGHGLPQLYRVMKGLGGTLELGQSGRSGARIDVRLPWEEIRGNE
jgi:sensor histidine kinase regulating citrate/malate metabolism